MTILEELKLMNYTKIEYLKECGSNYKRNYLIKELLKDEACFFKMKKEDSFLILQDIGVNLQSIQETYSKLISIDEYYRLLNNNKIKEDDNEIIIRYKKYDSNFF